VERNLVINKKTNMQKLISLNIDVSKIDAKRLYKGKKGQYLSATLFLKEEVDQYGNNGFIVESITKEEREQGKKGTIIGNAKYMVAGGPSKQEEVSDLPF
jgi:hypothetical protein